MENITKAIQLALEAHKGQVDKGGKPYILHPLHLMSQMTTEDEMVVAVLHDVVEDTTVTIGKLISMRFSDDSINALKLLTHSKEIPYMEYIKAIAKNQLARSVKLADLRHNMDIRRLPEVTLKDIKRLNQYKKAYEYLI